MTTTYEFHWAAELFPMMDTKSLDALKADIQEHGQREPVVLFNTSVLWVYFLQMTENDCANMLSHHAQAGQVTAGVLVPND